MMIYFFLQQIIGDLLSTQGLESGDGVAMLVEQPSSMQVRALFQSINKFAKKQGKGVDRKMVLFASSAAAFLAHNCSPMM